MTDTIQRVGAFAFVGFVLFVAADFEETSAIAVAFAWLIFLSAAMAVGPIAFDRIAKLFGSPIITSGAGGSRGKTAKG